VNSAIVGAAGDFFTFVGGSFLAWDAIHVKSNHEIEVGVNEATGRGRSVIIKGRKIERPGQTADLFEHLASRNAKIGFGLLAFGFFLLLIGRLMEIFC
jgi:hypothetical protein